MNLSRPVVDCSGDKIRTKQSFKKECDINNIMSRFVKTGNISPEALSKRQATFADVSEIGDFQECQNQIQDAHKAFMTLPPDLRARFENEPAQLLDFMKDENNREEAIELGIITKATETTPEPTPEPKANGTPTPPPPSAEGGDSGDSK